MRVCAIFAVCLVMLHVSELCNNTGVKHSHPGIQLDKF